MNVSDKRRQILAAASECLARFGYGKTTMEDIAGRIGLNKTSLYYYYPNKESIFIAVIVQEAEKFLGALQAKALKARGCRNRILSYLTERLRYYQHVVNLHNLSIETLQRIQPSFRGLYQDVLEREIDFIGQRLQDGMQSGEIKTDDARRLARIILTVTDALKQNTGTPPAQGLPDAIDYTTVEKDVVYTVGLMLDGLTIAPEGAQQRRTRP
jgi:AcrR family transcriptional regulator